MRENRLVFHREMSRKTGLGNMMFARMMMEEKWLQENLKPQPTKCVNCKKIFTKGHHCEGKEGDI